MREENSLKCGKDGIVVNHAVLLSPLGSDKTSHRHYNMYDTIIIIMHRGKNKEWKISMAAAFMLQIKRGMHNRVTKHPLIWLTDFYFR